MVDELAHALLPQGSFLTPFLNATGIYGIRYVLLAGTAFLVWYARRPQGKLQRAMPQRSQIRREIHRINQTGVSILLVEQNARAALQTADYGYVLETGEIVHSGAAADLMHDPKVAASYLGGH